MNRDNDTFVPAKEGAWEEVDGEYYLVGSKCKNM